MISVSIYSVIFGSHFLNMTYHTMSVMGNIKDYDDGAISIGRTHKENNKSTLLVISAEFATEVEILNLKYKVNPII